MCACACACVCVCVCVCGGGGGGGGDGGGGGGGDDGDDDDVDGGGYGGDTVKCTHKKCSPGNVSTPHPQSRLGRSAPEPPLAASVDKHRVVV
jgi:hypothetical protein